MEARSADPDNNIDNVTLPESQKGPFLQILNNMEEFVDTSIHTLVQNVPQVCKRNEFVFFEVVMYPIVSQMYPKVIQIPQDYQSKEALFVETSLSGNGNLMFKMFSWFI